MEDLALIMHMNTEVISNYPLLINLKNEKIEGFTKINEGVFIPDSYSENFTQSVKLLILMFNDWLDKNKYKYKDKFNETLKEELENGASIPMAYSCACFLNVKIYKIWT